MTEPVDPGTISPLPVTPPSFKDPANFEERGDAVIGHFPMLISEVNSVADKTKQNADAAKEKADAAAVSAASAGQDALDAMGHRNTAAAHAGTATTKAGEASSSAEAAALDRARAESAADNAERDAQAVADALEAIEGGPVASFNGRGGLVVSELGDVTSVMPEATKEEMQEGTSTDLRSVSPALIKSAVLQIGGEASPVGTVLTGAQAPSVGTWIEPGKTYLQASYPELYGKVGLQSDGRFSVGAQNITTGAWVFPAMVAGGGVLFVTGMPSSGLTTEGLRSTDGGVTWAPKTVPSGGWRYGASGGGLFVYVNSAASSSYITSGDYGQTWDLRTFPVSGSFQVYYDGAKWWAYSTFGATYTSSTGVSDWVQFTGYPSAIGAGTTLLRVARSGSLLALAYPSGIAVSSDGGATWVNRAGLAMGNASNVGLYGFRNRIIRVSAGVTAGQLIAEYTEDGVTWRSSPEQSPFLNGSQPSVWTSSQAIVTEKILLIFPGLDGNSVPTTFGVWTVDGATWGIFNFASVGAALNNITGASDGVSAAIARNSGSTTYLHALKLEGYTTDSQFYIPTPQRVSPPFKQWIKAI